MREESRQESWWPWHCSALARPDTKHRPVSVPRVTITLSAPTLSMKLGTPNITSRHIQLWNQHKVSSSSLLRSKEVLRFAMSNVCVSNEEQSSTLWAASSYLITCLNWLVLVWGNTELLTSSQFTPSRGQLTESGGAVAPHNIWQLFCRKYLTILIVYAPRCSMLLNQTCI